MRIIYLPRCFKTAWNNHFFHVPELSQEASTRLQGVLLWNRLRDHGLSSSSALHEVMNTFGKSHDTWYRWRRRFATWGAEGLESQSRRPQSVRTRTWDPRILHRIKILRNHEDTFRWGGEKIKRQLQKEGYTTPSVATISRMIAYLKKTRKIMPYIRKKRPQLPRIRATRYTKEAHGHLHRLQIDVDEYRSQGRRWYHFSAIERATRYVWGRAYGSHSSYAAKDFLMHILDSVPPGITISHVQVDGGSEFRGVFEAYCQKKSIHLLVNRPRTPKQNCYVERVHRTFDEECYQVRDMGDTLVSINEQLSDYCMFYNGHRFHAGIGYMTPCEKVAEYATIHQRGAG